MSQINRSIHKCHKCNKPAEKMSKCSKCKKVRYCSKKCQQDDWKEHKKNCIAIEDDIQDKGNDDSEQRANSTDHVEDLNEDNFELVKKISLIDIFEKVNNICCWKRTMDVALKNYILFEINNGKNLNFVQEKLESSYELKHDEGIKGMVHYFKSRIKDRYFSSKLISTFTKMIKDVDSHIRDEDCEKLIDHFFKYIEKDDFDYDVIFKIIAYKMQINESVALIFKCTTS